MTSDLQSLDQRIARSAHEAYEQAKKTNGFKEQDFRNAIKKAATRLRAAGLGVTLAFAIGKKEQHLQVAEAWCTALKDLGLAGCQDPAALLATYRTTDFARIRLLTEHSLRVLEWLAKWADAYKEPEKDRA
jgi:CRISPR/Cas system CMR-associated protein Cmr5 small subunit